MDVVRPLPANGDGEFRGERELSLEGSSAGPDIADRVPGFLDNEPSASVVPHKDVDGVGRVGQADRELETAFGADLGRVSQQQLLYRKVACVNSVLPAVAGILESWLKPQCRGERQPSPQRRAGAESEFETAHFALAQPDLSTQLCLGRSTT